MFERPGRWSVYKGAAVLPQPLDFHEDDVTMRVCLFRLMGPKFKEKEFRPMICQKKTLRA
jgi:hypothetical protein